GAAPRRRQAARDLEGRRSAIEHERARGLDERDGRLGDCDLLLVRDLEPALEWHRLRGRRERTAVHPSELAERGELLQVATDRVLRHAESRDELGDHDPAVTLEPSEDLVS